MTSVAFRLLAPLLRLLLSTGVWIIFVVIGRRLWHRFWRRYWE